MSEPIPEQFTRSITINASPAKVWDALTVPELMKQWMSQTPIEIITDWKVGKAITVKGDWYKAGFVNKGKVLRYEHEQLLEYSHLSSLSRLPDQPENYCIIMFRIIPETGYTALEVTLSNFPTDSIYRHFAFYWTVTIALLKKFIEQ